MTADESFAAEIRSVAHRAVTEGVNLDYVEQMRRTLYRAADLIETLQRGAERYVTAEREAANWREQLDQANITIGRLISVKPGDPLLDLVQSIRDELAKAGML